MAHKYYNVTIHTTVPKSDQVQKLLDPLTDDWMRYAPNGWLVYSSLSAHDIAYKIHAPLTKEEILFVVEINLQNRQGWLHQWMWDWIKKKR
jgi:hypothetical protein